MEAAGRALGIWAIVGLGGGYSKPKALKWFNLSFQRQNYPCSFKAKSKAEEGRKEKKKRKEKTTSEGRWGETTQNSKVKPSVLFKTFYYEILHTKECMQVILDSKAQS